MIASVLVNIGLLISLESVRLETIHFSLNPADEHVPVLNLYSLLVVVLSIG